MTLRDRTNSLPRPENRAGELGAIARAAGVPLDVNPYRREIPAFRFWEQGWLWEDREIEAGR